MDGETSPSNHPQIIKSQVNNVVTKIAREEREDLRKKLGKMDENEEEECSPLILVMSKLAGESHH